MPSLIYEITHSIMVPATTKGVFCAPYISYERYLGCYQVAFEIGAVLGYAFRNRLLTFVQLFCEQGHENELVKCLNELATEKLAEVGQPKDFLQLAMCHEESRIKAKWHEMGIPEEEIESRKKRHKMKLEQVAGSLGVAVSTGIGIGSSYPALIERLWKDAYECPISRAEWQKWRKAGLDIGDELPGPLSLAKRQEQLLSFVQLFVSKRRPELLSVFGKGG